MRELAIYMFEDGYEEEGIQLLDPYILSEIEGLGTSYNVKENRNFEYAFEPISFTINFKGKNNKNAYYFYTRFVVFISGLTQNQKLVLQYKVNGLTRYCDIMLKSITKSQLTTYRVLTERVTFERLSPFYEIVHLVSPGENVSYNTLINNQFIDIPMPLKIRIADVGNVVSRVIKLLNGGQEISRVQVSLKENYELVLDGYSKQAYYINRSTGARINAYDDINHQYDSFLIVPAQSTVTLNDQAGTVIYVDYKKWVVD